MIINFKKRELNQLKFIDLFCGIGGFHQALSNRLGSTCVLASDTDENCKIVYQENYGTDIIWEPDVKKINPETIPDFDIICAGFPCQAFSNAGKKKTFSDKRGLLFDEIMRIAKIKKPKFMFLENVKHILKVGNGEVIKYILNKIDEHGYKVKIYQISPHEYGIPQQRERVYFVCIRNDFYNKFRGDNGFPVIISPNIPVNFENYLQKKEEIPEKYFINGNINKCLSAWDEMIHKFNINEKISPTIMINEHYNNHTQDDFNNYATWRKDYITKNKPLISKYKKDFDEWYKNHKTILQETEVNGKLEWQVGPIKPNDSIFNYFIQIRQSGIRVKKAEYFPTLVAMTQTPIYGKEKRHITPRECARLQSFPNTFILPHEMLEKIESEDKHFRKPPLPDQVAYKQLGNSVNVDNVHTIISKTLSLYCYK